MDFYSMARLYHRLFRAEQFQVGEGMIKQQVFPFKKQK
jgi:hypothetical protein